MKTHFAPGIHPFWFWNGPLSVKRVEQRVAQLAEVGCAGVFIHPRQGMRVPYLSEEYFTLYRACIRACVAHGITPHMYDEFPYPSGMAGGEVCMGHPEFMATQLHQVQETHTGGSLAWQLPAGDLLQCLAVPLIDNQPQWDLARDLKPAAGIQYTNETWLQMGLSNYTNQRYFAHDPAWQVHAQLPQGHWLLSASVQGIVTNHKYWGAFVDVCDKEAMQRFITCTHERYAQALGDDLQHIGCCFVDETHPTWSRHFADAYAQRHNEELATQLIALQQSRHPHHQELQQRLDDLRYDLFVDAFEQPIAAWCRAHDILYVAEKPLLRVDQLRYVDIPGCDTCHTRCGAPHDMHGAELRSNARAMSSAAQLYNKDSACCEAYHSMGWSATLEDARFHLDLLLLNGIDRLVTHGFFETTHGLAKHDAPPSWFDQRPDWPHNKFLAERLQRMHAHIGKAHHDADCVVIDPRLHRRHEAAAPYQALLHNLSASCREYLIVDRVWLLEQDPQQGQILDHVRSIILSRAIHDAALNAWLEIFTAAGGKVYHDEIPDDHDALGCRVHGGLQADLQQSRFLTNDGLLLMAVNTSSTALEMNIPDGFQAIDIGDALTAAAQNTLKLDAYASVCLKQIAAPPTATVAHLPWPKQWQCQAEHMNLARLARWNFSVEQDGQKHQGRTRVSPKPIGDQIDEAGIALHYQRHCKFGQRAEWSLPTVRAHYHSQISCSETLHNVYIIIEPESIRGRNWHLSIDQQRYSAADFNPVDGHVDGSLGVCLATLVAGTHPIHIEIELDRDDDGLLAPVYIGGDCAVALQPLRLSAPITNAAFGDLDAAGLCHYAGSIRWSCSLQPAITERGLLDIDLSFCASDCYEIRFNHGPWHAIDWSPRRLQIDASELQGDHVDCEIRQFTTLGRSFDGERWNAAAHKLEVLSDD